MKSVSVKSYPSMFRRGIAKPINFTMFEEIFSIIGGILSTISGSMFQTITFFPSLVNYVVLQTINDCTINLLCYFLDLHLHYSKLACNFIPSHPPYFFFVLFKSRHFICIPREIFTHIFFLLLSFNFSLQLYFWYLQIYPGFSLLSPCTVF